MDSETNTFLVTNNMDLLVTFEGGELTCSRGTLLILPPVHFGKVDLFIRENRLGNILSTY